MKYVLFALLMIGPNYDNLSKGRETSWTADFSSKQTCLNACKGLSRRFSHKVHGYTAIVDCECFEK